MPFPYDKYPWLNFQELNLAYFIKHFREIFQQWDQLYHDLIEWKEATDQDLADWKSATEAGLESWKTGLTASLEAWKSQTATDISGWETATIAALDAWKTATTTVFEQIRTEAAGSASAAAASASQADTARAAAASAQSAAEQAAAEISAELAQIQTNTADIADLKNAFDEITEQRPSSNIVNESDLLTISGATYDGEWYSYLAGDASAIWGQSDNLPSFPHREIKSETQYTMSFDGKYNGTPASGFVIGFKYTDGTLTPLATFGGEERHYTATSTAGKTIAKIYFGWNYNVQSYIKNFMIVEGTSEPSNFIPYYIIKAVDETARKDVGILKNVILPADLLNYEQGENLYNYYNLIRNKYINPNTGLISDTEYASFAYSPTYIPVSEGETLTATDRMIIAYYDAQYNILSALQMDASKQTIVPSGAVYARFSVSSNDQSTVKVVKGESINADVGKYSFHLNGLKTDADATVIVDINGNGDYTSFTEAIYDTVDSGSDVIVKAGSYDIEAEYIAKFGQTVVDNLADSTIGIKNFQYGIRIHDRKVTFEAGSHLVCDWTGHTVNATHRFCPLRIEPNAELIGLDLDCTATFYGIHDDYGTADDSAFTVKYTNCRIIGHNLFNANCIGGGAHKYSRHILKNCYFKNNVNSDDIVLSADVRYHNANTADAEPELYVSNCYFSNNMNVTYYGNQTTKMKVYVNNCYAPKGVVKRAESPTMQTDNVELYTWNNQTT